MHIDFNGDHMIEDAVKVTKMAIGYKIIFSALMKI